MRTKLHTLTSVLLLLTLLHIQTYGKTLSDMLVYNQPATKWLEALPLGNGRIGAMVYGGLDEDTVALNEVTMWSGQPDPQCNDLCGPDKLRELRKAFLDGDLELGNQLGWESLCGHGKSFGTHLPMGDLVIKQQGAQTDVSGYRRTLDLNEAMASVSYKHNGINYKREYFASNPSQVLVMRFSADRRASVSATLSMRMLRHATVTSSLDKDVSSSKGFSSGSICIDGDARFNQNGEGGVKFRGIVRIKAEGGTVRADNGQVTIDKADAMTVIIDIRTNFNSTGYAQHCLATVRSASSVAYERLRREHVADFKSIYGRMKLALPQDAGEAPNTLHLYRKARSGERSAAFDQLFFNYGRYMQIASSRENSPLPSNLQGIWNDNRACNMPWRCDYHLDINIQQNYWSANIANMAETNTPLFSYMDMLARYGHETAMKVYGCDGWVAHTINNVWGDTAPGGSVGWGLNVTAGAWMMTHLWTHYEFTQDTTFLRMTAYPLLKETAKFFVDYMVEDPHTGWLLTGPSISPENSFTTPDGHDYSLSMMPTIDRVVIYDIYNACIQGSRILETDTVFRRQLERDILRLPPLQTNEEDELKEWLVPGARRSNLAHRHSSHLLALYPFGQISVDETPALAKACGVFLERQSSQTDWEDTEWTRANNINYYARLHDGQKAHASLSGIYSGFMRENLMTVSPAGVAGAENDIFSFDANEAAVAGMCEMLLQSKITYSQAGETVFLDFLPALPSLWSSGAIRGICARGGIEADFEWKDGKVTKAILCSNRDQVVHLRINGQENTIVLRIGKSVRII